MKAAVVLGVCAWVALTLAGAGPARAQHGAAWGAAPLARGLAEDDPKSRAAAASAAAPKWPEGARAVPALLEALRDDDGGVRAAAAEALAALAKRSEAAISAAQVGRRLSDLLAQRGPHGEPRDGPGLEDGPFVRRPHGSGRSRGPGAQPADR